MNTRIPNSYNVRPYIVTIDIKSENLMVEILVCTIVGPNLSIWGKGEGCGQERVAGEHTNFHGVLAFISFNNMLRNCAWSADVVILFLFNSLTILKITHITTTKRGKINQSKSSNIGCFAVISLSSSIASCFLGYTLVSIIYCIFLIH